MTTLEVLQHALGRDAYGRRKEGLDRDYRNHYVTGEGSESYDVCRDAAEKGLMTEHAGRAISGGDPIFVVTDDGRAYVDEHSPKAPKLTRSQARYREFLRADSNETFGEWLRGRSV